MVGELLSGMVKGGARRADVRVYEKEPDGLHAELTTPGRAAADAGGPVRVVVLMCHEDRPGVERVLDELGFRAVEGPDGLSGLGEASAGSRSRRK
jgi:hypothetical protein